MSRLESSEARGCGEVASRSAAAHEFEFTELEFERLRSLVHSLTGIALSEAKRELVYGRLARRVRKLRFASFAEYCEFLETGDAAELQELTNAITTNLTSFFREQHHFECLATEALPFLERKRAGTRRLRIWSAGCSTGEEPYSIAMVMREAFARLAGWDIKLLATDIDSAVVARAAEGVYPTDRFLGMSSERVDRWFRSVPEKNRCLEASAELKELITFNRLNLIDSWPMKGPFDIIFCRNVVIYFDIKTRRELFARMAALQEPGAWLFIGHSENLFNVTQQYQLVGRTVYRRGK